MRADLHMHSFWSDGNESPTSLVERAIQKGYGAVALTDHDNVSGVEEFTACARAHGLLTTTGVELTAFDGQEIHILAYGVDVRAGSDFSRVLSGYQAARAERFRKMREGLARCGHAISDEEIQTVAKGSVSRLHLARILLARGDVSTLKEAYVRFLYRGQPGHAEYAEKLCVDVVRDIKSCGGIAVLAHLGRFHWTEEKEEAVVKSLVDVGLDGIESFYATHTTQEVQRYVRLANKYGLLNTLGSDYHGDGDAWHGNGFSCDELPKETARALFGV